MKPEKVLLFAFLLVPLPKEQIFAVMETASVPTETRFTSPSKVSLSFMRTAFQGKTPFVGNGQEVSLVKPLFFGVGLGGSLGQAYSISQRPETFFTTFSVDLWFSILGSLERRRSFWFLENEEMASYTENSSKGLRLGVGMQNYLFNTSKGVFPFSGLLWRLVYEFGLQGGYDLMVGLETADVSNIESHVRIYRSSAGIVWSLAPTQAK